MNELDLIPEAERFRVADALASDGYAGRLASVLQEDERVALASLGRINTRELTNRGAQGDPALLLLTQHRLLAIPQRSKSLFGKVKEPAPIAAGFTPDGPGSGNVFDCGTLRASHYEILVSICGPAPSGHPGQFITWRLNFGSNSAPGYGDVWRVNIMDLAEANGGTQRRPAGL